jgi:hypothetical protein
MKKIEIIKSPTFNSLMSVRKTVTKEDLIKSTEMHIKDVQNGIKWFIFKLFKQGEIHDYTKKKYIDLFYKDFTNNFTTNDWYYKHQTEERHHITAPNGLREDVDLVDIIENVIDGVVAGMARNGEYYYREIPAEILQKACKNTAEKLIADIIVKKE